MKIVAGINGALAVRVSKLTGFPLCYSQLHRHPDGEIYFRLGCDVEGEEVLIFDTMHPKPERSLLTMALIADAAKAAGAEAIYCVIPYIAYARTDVRREGEPLAVNVLNKIFAISGVEKIYTVDFHLQKNVFDAELVDMTAMDLLAEYLSDRLSKPTVLAPDERAVVWAEKFAEVVDARDIVELRRIRVDVESFVFQPPRLSIEGSAVIVDDIVCTGATVSQIARIAKRSGAKDVYVACTHAILTEDALMRILASGVEEMVATDTVVSPVSRVSVAERIAERLIAEFG
ncbi:MAG: ribose-phosphate diphosphokinase [Archaeoglobaceae archaeon]